MIFNIFHFHFDKVPIVALQETVWERQRVQPN